MVAGATLDGTRKGYLAELATVSLLIVDDFSMGKLPHTAAEDLPEVIITATSVRHPLDIKPTRGRLVKAAQRQRRCQGTA
jgi:hypothetical protein